MHSSAGTRFSQPKYLAQCCISSSAIGMATLCHVLKLSADREPCRQIEYLEAFYGCNQSKPGSSRMQAAS